MAENEAKSPLAANALDIGIIQMLFDLIETDIELVDNYHYASRDETKPRDLLDHMAVWRNGRLSEAVAERLHDVLGISRAPETVYSDYARVHAEMRAKRENPDV